MTIFVPIFLLVFLASVTLIFSLACQTLLQRWANARKTAFVLAATLFVYAAVLIGVSLRSREETLPMGAVKCFDDWCVRVKSARRNANQLTIHLETINRGRRAQAPDSPQAFLVENGHAKPVDIPNLKDKIEGGSTNQISVNIPLPVEAKNLSFLVTEGGGPSLLIIDDENSPFHAKSTWTLGH